MAGKWIPTAEFMGNTTVQRMCQWPCGTTVSETVSHASDWIIAALVCLCIFGSCYALYLASKSGGRIEKR